MPYNKTLAVFLPSHSFFLYTQTPTTSLSPLCLPPIYILLLLRTQLYGVCQQYTVLLLVVNL